MQKSDNKRIAKNTLFLYFRMIVIILISLYTSRVILNVLGFEDYGIYNLVSGVVVMFSFLNGSMTSSTQRYLCVAQGKDDKNYESEVFKSSLFSHLLVSFAFVIIAEIAGVWFIYNVLNIPPGKILLANMVYQIALLTSIFNIFKVPFNAAIIANEHLSFYAYSSIVEAVLKLLIILPLIYVEANKLILYAILVLSVQVSLCCWYMWFVKSHYGHYKLSIRNIDKKIVKEMFIFTGWSNFSGIAMVVSKQGLGFILNIFFGVVINSAVGIMNQFTAALYGFIQNFQLAINPPLIKNYSSGNYEAMQQLYVSSAKYSYYLLLLISVPITFNVDYILELWLKEVPEYTNWFCVLSLLTLLPNTIGGPIWTVMQATGKIKYYQWGMSALILLNLPVDYLLLYLGFPPYSTLYVNLVSNILVVVMGAYFVRRYAEINLTLTFGKIMMPCIFTTAICFICGWGVQSLLSSYATDILMLFVRLISICLPVVAIIFFLGMTGSERHAVQIMVLSRLHHEKK